MSRHNLFGSFFVELQTELLGKDAADVTESDIVGEENTALEEAWYERGERLSRRPDPTEVRARKLEERLGLN